VTCPSGLHYNMTLSTCFACPQGFTFDASNYVCTAATTTCTIIGQYYNPLTNECVCVSPTPYFDGTRCVSCNSPNYWNTFSNTCLTCPSGQFYNVTINSCTYCPVGFLFNLTTGQCQVSCPANSFWSSLQNSCLQCPAGTYLVPNTQQCFTCPAGFVYNQVTGQCTSSTANCPDGTQWSTAYNQCVACSSGITWDPVTRTCITCPSGFTYDINLATCVSGGGNGTITHNCPAEAPFWNGTNCLSCLLPSYWNYDTNRC
jgi:hypothetical protein